MSALGRIEVAELAKLTTPLRMTQVVGHRGVRADNPRTLSAAGKGCEIAIVRALVESDRKAHFDLVVAASTIDTTLV